MSPEQSAQGAYVYAIKDSSGFVKFGITKTPRGRLETLQTGNALELRIAGSMKRSMS